MVGRDGSRASPLRVGAGVDRRVGCDRAAFDILFSGPFSLRATFELGLVLLGAGSSSFHMCIFAS